MRMIIDLGSEIGHRKGTNGYSSLNATRMSAAC